MTKLRVAVATGFVLVLGACGVDTFIETDGSTDGSPADRQIGDSTSGDSSSGDSSTMDAGKDAKLDAALEVGTGDSGSFDSCIPPGWSSFTCGSSPSCNPTTSFCNEVSASLTSCQLIPVGCACTHTCACLLAHQDASCGDAAPNCSTQNSGQDLFLSCN